MEYIGLIGGTITTLGGVPQIYKIIKTKRADDLSWGMLCMWITGLSMNLSYGISTRQIAVAIPTSSSLCMTCIMFFCKLYYKNKYIVLQENDCV